jgi:CRISPR/Cas system-associated exonuclease Cas4 (RecB family)
MPARISAWSFSRLSTFETCKLWAKLAYIDKIPEPPRPLPPGKTEHANDRGSRIHEAGELFVKAEVELIPELEKFAQEFQNLKDLYKTGRVLLEVEWGFDRNWNPVAWMSSDVWARIKPDAVILSEDGTSAVCVDYKTGRKSGNEVKHQQQMQLYQLAVLLRFPDIEKVTVELWYLDQDELTSMVYTRKQGMRYLDSFTDRGDRLTTEEEFAPSPNQYGCRWCPFGPKGTGHCKVGIQK